MMASSTRSGEDFAYATGRVGALQQRLLSMNDVDQLIGSRTEEELQRIILETKFTNVVAHTMQSLDDLVPLMEQWLYRELESMLQETSRQALDILWLKEDAPLIASLLKRYFGFTKVETDSRSPCAHNPLHLRDLILHNRPHHELPLHLTRFVERQKRKEYVTPALIDTSVARYVARTQLELAKASGSVVLELYVKHHIDLQNLRIARRLKENDDPLTIFLPGGEVNPMLLIGDRRKVSTVLRGTSLHFAFTEQFETAEDSSIAIERSLLKALAHDVAHMRSNILGLESAFAYTIIALSQLKILRTILIAKRAGLKTDELRQMLPPFLSTSPYTS